MKITQFDIEASLKAHFRVIVRDATDVPCDNFYVVEESIAQIQEVLNSIKERVAIGKQIVSGKPNPVIVFKSDDTEPGNTEPEVV